MHQHTPAQPGDAASDARDAAPRRAGLTPLPANFGETCVPWGVACVARPLAQGASEKRAAARQTPN
jgi:hypothetical protein